MPNSAMTQPDGRDPPAGTHGPAGRAVPCRAGPNGRPGSRQAGTGEFRVWGDWERRVRAEIKAGVWWWGGGGGASAREPI